MTKYVYTTVEHCCDDV